MKEASRGRVKLTPVFQQVHIVQQWKILTVVHQKLWEYNLLRKGPAEVKVKESSV